MAKLLFIETSTPVCSVGISDNEKMLAMHESDSQNAHAASVAPFIKAVSEESGIALKDLDAVVVSEGPGSYTGLRIGVSTAKGLCYALQKPLIAISSLKSMAFEMSKRHPESGNLFCPMIDAMRMEVYASIFDVSNNEIRKTQADIVDAETYLSYLTDHPIYFFGDGAEKCKSVLSQHPNAHFEKLLPSVSQMISLGEQAFAKKQFVDLAYFEPFYLKDFIAGKPVVKGLYV